MADHLATDPRPAAAGLRARDAEAAADCVRAGFDWARRPQPVAAQRDSRVPDHGNDGGPARDGTKLVRTLEGRTIRWCIRLVTAGTLAFLPFSGVSMLHAAVIAILAAGLEYSVAWARRAARLPLQAHPRRSSPPRAATRTQQ